MNTAAQPGTGARPVIVFVLGMARSGTSALTRVLSLCGGALPSHMAGANAANPLGYWEPRKAIVLNEVIMRRLGTSRVDPTLRLQDEGAIDARAKATSIDEIRAYLRTMPAAPFVVIKDPRINVLSGLWFEAAELSGFDVATVIAVRHPEEVNASVGAHSPVPTELASALWLKANLLAERDTRGRSRVFVEYANLLDDWRRELKRISAALGLDLNTQDEGAIDEFLKPDLRRQRYSGPVTEPFGTNWVSTVYDVLCAAARDEPCDESVLDRTYDAYRTSERGFRTVLEEFRGLQRVNRIATPSIMKLIYEGMAIAHRRKGPWA